MDSLNSNKCIHDSKALYKELFSTYYAPLVGFSESYLKNHSEAEDIVQNTFMKLWKIRDAIDYDSNVKSLLFTSVKNGCINILRTRKSASKYKDTTEAELLLQIERSELALEYSTITHIELNELQQQIDSILESLPTDYRVIFEKQRIEGKSYLQIAEELKISVKTVEKKMTKTLKIFRKELNDYHYTLFFHFFT